jgi:hypothetical protein
MSLLLARIMTKNPPPAPTWQQRSPDIEMILVEEFPDIFCQNFNYSTSMPLMLFNLVS